MPDKDITLGEVYRAILSLKEEFGVTRKEFQDQHSALRAEQAQHALAMAAAEVEIRTLKERVLVLEAADPKNGADPTARVGAVVGSGLAGLLSWWLSRGAGQ